MYSSMDQEDESLYHSNSSRKTSDVERSKNKLSHRPISSTNNYLTPISLAYFLIFLGIILHDYQVLAGKKKFSVLNFLALDNIL